MGEHKRTDEDQALVFPCLFVLLSSGCTSGTGRM